MYFTMLAILNRRETRRRSQAFVAVAQARTDAHEAGSSVHGQIGGSADGLGRVELGARQRCVHAKQGQDADRGKREAPAHPAP